MNTGGFQCFPFYLVSENDFFLLPEKPAISEVENKTKKKKKP